MNLTKLSIFVLALTAILYGCKKDNSDSNSGTTNLSIRLTDNPYNATEVNVDIRQVRINYNDDAVPESGWIDLPTHVGVYNLLNYQNGIDTLIAQHVVPLGTIKEIRLVLGSQNSIKIDNTLYPLTIPSGSESGLKIKLQKQLIQPAEILLIDFDAALSIHQEGNGNYKLKPVLKIK